MPRDALLSGLEHDDAWHAARAGGIGGSDAIQIVSGAWLALWEQKTGRREPEDLSHVLPVQLGSFTEAFNLAWFERQTGLAVSTAGCEGLVHPTHSFIRCNLDGVCADGIFEAKHVNGFFKPDRVVEKYYPQLQHNMAVTGVGMAFLSVLFGNHDWQYFEVSADPAYQGDLIRMEAEFWRHVDGDTPPGEGAVKPVAIDLDDMREVDMSSSNAWVAAAADWLENRAASRKFENAGKAIRGLVEPDIRRASGGGVEIARARDNSIRIKEVK